MGVEFVNITVNTLGLYQTSVRDYGTVALIGNGGTADTAPVKIGSYGEAEEKYASTALGLGVKNALVNGAASVIAVDCGTPTLTSVNEALGKIEGYDIQVVALAGIVETADNAFISTALKNHVDAASTERIGVFQLGKDQDATTMPTTIGGLLTANNSRLFGIAHKSDNDVACAAAGLIASLKPQESPFLKPITNIVQTVGFTTTQITALKNAQINVLVDPVYLTGNAYVLGSDYTLGTPSAGINFIDTRRVIDDVAYKLKAGLTDPSIIGTVHITKSGLSIMLGRLSGILQKAVTIGEIESYKVNFPILNALSKPVASRSDAETALISGARTARAINGEVSIEYAGVLHVINIDVKITV